MASAVALKTGRVNQALDAGPLALPSPTAYTVQWHQRLRAQLAARGFCPLQARPCRVRP